MEFTMGNLSSIASARHMNSGSDHNCSLALERAICWDGSHCSLVWDLMLRFFGENHSQDWLVCFFFGLDEQSSKRLKQKASCEQRFAASLCGVLGS